MNPDIDSTTRFTPTDRGDQSREKIADVLRTASRAEIAASPDLLLQASRRIDWRFLLSRPELNRVAYLGSADEMLLEALDQFSNSLQRIDLEGGSENDARAYDVVVVKTPTDRHLRQAAQLVAPGGFLYVEAERRDRGSAIHRPAQCLSMVRSCGFQDVQAYWHWPNFVSCTEMLDLNDRSAVRYFLNQRARSGKSRWKILAGRGLLYCGLLERMVKCFSVVAQREDA